MCGPTEVGSAELCLGTSSAQQGQETVPFQTQTDADRCDLRLSKEAGGRHPSTLFVAPARKRRLPGLMAPF